MTLYYSGRVESAARCLREAPQARAARVVLDFVASWEFTAAQLDGLLAKKLVIDFAMAGRTTYLARAGLLGGCHPSAADFCRRRLPVWKQIRLQPASPLP